MNRVCAIGRLTRQVESRQTVSGKTVCSFTIAVNRYGQQDKTDYIPCQAWGKLGENLEKYTTKGSLIGIDGRLQSGSYVNNSGQTVYTLDVVAEEIQFLDQKKKE